MKNLLKPLIPTWLIYICLFSGLSLSGEARAHSSGGNFGDLVESSELVIYGTVVNKTYYQEPILMDTFSSDGKGNSIKRIETWNEILTDYEIEVYGVHKGKYEKPIIRLTVRGGTVDGKRLTTSGTFYLTEGNKYYFFLIYEQRNDKWWAVWHRQGIFKEVEVKGIKTIRGIDGNTAITFDGDMVPSGKGSDKDKLNVEHFISRIRASDHERDESATQGNTR